MNSVTEQLKTFFEPGNWQSSIDRFPKSGYALEHEVERLGPRFVVDVGCGYNPFKGRIPNLIGIDLVNPAADLICDLKDAPIRPRSISVALALGSINFGTEDDIIENLAAVRSWLVPRGVLFMRGNPGEPIGGGVPIFPWSPTNIKSIGLRVGLELRSPIEEENILTHSNIAARRLFWSYVAVDAKL